MLKEVLGSRSTYSLGMASPSRGHGEQSVGGRQFSVWRPVVPLTLAPRPSLRRLVFRLMVGDWECCDGVFLNSTTAGTAARCRAAGLTLTTYSKRPMVHHAPLWPIPGSIAIMMMAKSSA